jgi:hypothetical protein
MEGLRSLGPSAGLWSSRSKADLLPIVPAYTQADFKPCEIGANLLGAVSAIGGIAPILQMSIFSAISIAAST